MLNFTGIIYHFFLQGSAMSYQRTPRVLLQYRYFLAALDLFLSTKLQYLGECLWNGKLVYFVAKFTIYHFNFRASLHSFTVHSEEVSPLMPFDYLLWRHTTTLPQCLLIKLRDPRKSGVGGSDVAVRKNDNKQIAVVLSEMTGVVSDGESVGQATYG